MNKYWILLEVCAELAHPPILALMKINIPLSLLSETQSEYCLLELPAGIPEPGTGDEGWTVQAARENDPLVLCTANQTFLLKRSLSTNSILLVRPTSDRDADVVSVLADHVELAPMKQRADSMLLGVLAERKPQTIRELSQMLPCSKMELTDALDRQFIPVWGDQILSVPRDDLYYIMRIVCAHCQSDTGTSLATRHAAAICALKQDQYNEDLIYAVISRFTGSKEDTGLSDNKIIRFFGEYLLETRARWSLSEFVDKLKEIWPGSDDYLRSLTGLYLIEDDSIFYYPEYRLPMQPMERFPLLFQMRQKWLYDDILPFIQPLSECNCVPLDNILAKYARSVVDSSNKRWIVSK